MKIFLLLILIPLICVSFYAQTAKELNSLGYNLYKEGKYVEALEYFKRSIEANPEYHYPHYNYACTIGILISSDYCSWFYELDNLFSHLEKTIELRPEYREKIKSDPDLDAVKHYYRYHELIGLNPEKTEDVIQILTSAEWKGPQSPGVYGQLSGIKFNQEGTLSFWELVVTVEMVGRDSYEGTYKVNGNRIFVHFNTPINGKYDYPGILDGGSVRIEGCGTFNDYAGDCGV